MEEPTRERWTLRHHRRLPWKARRVTVLPDTSRDHIFLASRQKVIVGHKVLRRLEHYPADITCMVTRLHVLDLPMIYTAATPLSSQRYCRPEAFD